MRSTMRACLDQILDYAGLFPPAQLTMEAALNTYLHARQTSPQRWMLSRFVCPTSRLHELAALAKRHPEAAALQIAALGQQSAKPGDFIDQVRADIEIIQDFRAGWNSDAVIGVFEVALPKGTTIAHLQSQLAYVPEELGEMGLAGFLEVPMSASWIDDVANLSDILHDMQHTQPHGIVGMKLRCGGVTAAAFPTYFQVAHFIARCAASHLPWKATAGLHHPRPHWDDALAVWHHGFLNVVGAGLLARVHPLTDVNIIDILADRNAEFFRIEDETFAWRDWSCTAAQIADARTGSVASFGSCNFEEPRADLLAMGLLDASDRT